MKLNDIFDLLDPSVTVYVYSYSDCLDMGTAEEFRQHFCLYGNYDINTVVSAEYYLASFYHLMR